MPGRRRKPEGVGTKVEDSLVRHHYLPVVRALRLPGATTICPWCAPCGCPAPPRCCPTSHQPALWRCWMPRASRASGTR